MQDLQERKVFTNLWKGIKITEISDVFGLNLLMMSESQENLAKNLNSKKFKY